MYVFIRFWTKTPAPAVGGLQVVWARAGPQHWVTLASGAGASNLRSSPHQAPKGTEMCVGQRRAPVWAPQLSPPRALVAGGTGPCQAPTLLVTAGAGCQQGGVSVAAAPGRGAGDCASPALGLPWGHASQECPGHGAGPTLPSRNHSLEGTDFTAGRRPGPVPSRGLASCPGGPRPEEQ